MLVLKKKMNDIVAARPNRAAQEEKENLALVRIRRKRNSNLLNNLNMGNNLFEFESLIASFVGLTENT